jgi:hypothetical protein
MKHNMPCSTAGMWKLIDKIGLFEKTTGVDLDIDSDDGLSDLLYHTVGLGKIFFNLQMSNPKYLEEDYKKHIYTESFAYCFQKPEPVKPLQTRQQIIDDLHSKLGTALVLVNTINDHFRGIQARVQALKDLENQTKDLTKSV